MNRPQGYSTITTGSVVEVNSNTTDTSATIPNPDTWIKFFDVDAHTYSKILIQANVEILNGITSTTQTITINMGIDTSLKPFVVASSAVSQRFRFLLQHSAVLNAAGGRVGVKCQAPQADVNTNIIVKNLFVYGII